MHAFIEFPFWILTFSHLIYRMWIRSKIPNKRIFHGNHFKCEKSKMENVWSKCFSLIKKKLYFRHLKNPLIAIWPYETKAPCNLSTSTIRSYCVYIQPFDVIIAVIQLICCPYLESTNSNQTSLYRWLFGNEVNPNRRIVLNCCAKIKLKCLSSFARANAKLTLPNWNVSAIRSWWLWNPRAHINFPLFF